VGRAFSNLWRAIAQLLAPVGATSALARGGRETIPVAVAGRPAGIACSSKAEGEVNEEAQRTKMMKAIHPCVVAAAIFLLPAAAFAQRSGDPANIEGRLNVLQQRLADLSARTKELKIRDEQLHQRLEDMRTNFEARIGQQENGAKGKAR